MKFLILGLLLSQPRSLYDVHGHFANGLSHIYSASFGSIHRALRQLLAAGDATVVDVADSARNKKHYLATPQGRQVWFEWMKRPHATEDVEATMLARVFLLGLLENPEDRRDVLIELHRRARDEFDELRAVDVSLGTREDVPLARYPRAALDYGLRSSEGAVIWIEELLAEVASPPRVENAADDGR